MIPEITPSERESIHRIRESLKQFPSPFQIGDAVYCLFSRKFGVVVGLHDDDDHSGKWTFLVQSTHHVAYDGSNDDSYGICWFDAEMLRSADTFVFVVAEPVAEKNALPIEIDDDFNWMGDSCS